jgi:hypothetical protein
MSSVPSRMRYYPEVEDDEVRRFIARIPDYYGKGPAQLDLSFNSPNAMYANPAEMRWRMPCEKLGEQDWEEVYRSTEAIRTCGCKYCQAGFDLILRWRIMR